METGKWGMGNGEWGVWGRRGAALTASSLGLQHRHLETSKKRGKSDHDGRLWGLPLLLPAALPAIGRLLSSLLIADAKQGKQGRGANSIHSYRHRAQHIFISFSLEVPRDIVVDGSGWEPWKHLR